MPVLNVYYKHTKKIISNNSDFIFNRNIMKKTNLNRRKIELLHSGFYKFIPYHLMEQKSNNFSQVHNFELIKNLNSRTLNKFHGIYFR
jgi:hypothetical protein